MCLHPKRGKDLVRFTVTEPITVYKCVTPSFSGGYFFPPFFPHFQYRIGETAESVLETPKTVFNLSCSHGSTIGIDIGLHSVADLDAAQQLSRGGVVLECQIPIGAEAYHGSWIGIESYASNKLHVIKQVER